MIIYAGVSVLDQTPELQAMLDNIWEPQWLEFYRPSNCMNQIMHGVWPKMTSTSTKAPRLGVLRWPTSVNDWATLYAICDDQQLRDIIKKVGSETGGAFYGYGWLLDIGDGTNTLTIPHMQMLLPRPICQTPRKSTDPIPTKATNDLWLLQFVDNRYWATQALFASATGTYTSWTSLLTQYITAMKYAVDADGVYTYTIDSIPSAYGSPQPERWLSNSYSIVPASILADAAAEAVGGRLTISWDLSHPADETHPAHTPAQDPVRVWRPLAAKAVSLAAYDSLVNEVISGGLLNPSDIANSCPGNCTVYYDSYAASGSITGHASYSWDLSSLGISDSGSIAGNVGPTAVVYSESPTASGSAPTLLDAKQIATDWYNWRFASRVDARFRGIHPWPINGADWCVEWSTGLYGSTPPSTRVYPLPSYSWDRWGAPQPKQIFRSAITGSKGGNVALGNLLTFLKNNGIIDDSTT